MNFSGSPPAPDPAVRWTALVGAHLRRYPLLTAQDVLKLLQQAVLGPAHALAGLDQVRATLQAEAANLGDGPAEPIVDPLGNGGMFARVHLRPYLALGASADLLAVAFAESAVLAERSEALPAALRELQAAAAAGTLPASLVPLRDLTDDLLTPVSHSPAFRRAYRPAYRVVACSSLPGLGVPLP